MRNWLSIWAKFCGLPSCWVLNISLPPVRMSLSKMALSLMKSCSVLSREVSAAGALLFSSGTARFFCLGLGAQDMVEMRFRFGF